MAGGIFPPWLSFCSAALSDCNPRGSPAAARSPELRDAGAEVARPPPPLEPKVEDAPVWAPNPESVPPTTALSVEEAVVNVAEAAPDVFEEREALQGSYVDKGNIHKSLTMEYQEPDAEAFDAKNFEGDHSSTQALYGDGADPKARPRRGPSFGGRRTCWTVMFIMTWAILLVGLAMTHVAVGGLVPALVDFPDNLLKGFMQSLKFSELGEDAVKVRDASERAMLACNTTVAQCKGGLLDDEAVVEAAAGSSGRRLSAVDPADLATIQGSVGNSFTSVNRVASDQYFGVDKLQRVAAPTQTVMDNAQELKGKVECDATAPLYCGIYQASELLVASAADARQAVHDIANSETVQSVKEDAEYLRYLHALPYVLIVAMMYFTCFWYRDFGCCCCGGSCLGCVAIIFHLVFWLVHFVITVVMVAIGVAYKYAKHTLKVKAPLKGDPSLEEIIEHIRKFFQPLYEIAIQPLEAPMVLFWHASIVILAFCLLIELYGCCVCVCRPYRESQKVNEAIHDGKEKNAKTV